MLNAISIMGRMTRDPDLRYTQGGTAVANFTLACERDYSAEGKKETDFIDVVVWQKTAEIVAEHFRKGTMAVATGRLQTRTYTDKNGNNRKAVEIVAQRIYFGESKADADRRSGRAQGGPGDYVNESLADDSGDQNIFYDSGFDDGDVPW